MFNCRIGTEHEKFGFDIQTLRPMKYEQISELLYGISERFDWEKVMEDDYIIGLKQVLFLPELKIKCVYVDCSVEVYFIWSNHVIEW